MGENNALVKSHIPGEDINGEIFSMGLELLEPCCILELGFLTFFFFVASNFLCFDLLFDLGKFFLCF